ncbi:hypothetical protein [Sulfitobacter sp.]|uniref:hypothetical protein n=1 Tax=Sulfitobacter sp. TaxID=1903071 RepID=UPI002627A8B0|nr:hypothetical protein [Sulfitobacter sp.]|tara:strand:- start:182 stop:502 length:321 start_codon:yes stop_codon:yes gene_type:complete
MTLKRRIAKLEDGPTEPMTVFATVPTHWSTSESAMAIEVEALAQGHKAPFFTFPMPQEGADRVAILGSERMGDLLEYVAQHGSHMGKENMPNAASTPCSKSRNGVL